VRPEDRTRGPRQNRFDDDNDPRGPPPLVQNSRFAAAAAEMEVEREAETKEREERRAMRGPPRDMEGPPLVPTNSRFAAAAASHEVDREREMREREERHDDRQRQYGDDRGGQGGGRYGDDRGGQGGGGQAGGSFGGRMGREEQGGGRYGDDREGQGGGRYGDDRGGQAGGRFGGSRMGRGQGENVFPSSMKDRQTTTFVKPELPSHLQPKKAEEPVLPSVEAPLALPGEDEEAAKARIEKKRREEEETKLAEQKAAEEAAAKKLAEKAATAEKAKEAAEVESDLLDEFISGGKSGAELKEWCATQGAILPSVEKLVYHLLISKQRGDPSPDCPWAEQANFGAALASLVSENLSAMMEILFAIQRFCNEIGFPKINNEGLIQAMFRNMYKFDLADEDAFVEWKDNESPEREEGKGKAIIQSMDWFNWLEEEDEESDEDYEDEYEE